MRRVEYPVRNKTNVSARGASGSHNAQASHAAIPQTTKTVNASNLRTEASLEEPPPGLVYQSATTTSRAPGRSFFLCSASPRAFVEGQHLIAAGSQNRAP